MNKRSKIFEPEKFEDLGFGSKVGEQRQRFVNKDGSFNVDRRGLSFFQNQGIYHALITMSWTKFIFIVFIFYILLNAVFAALYVLIGIDHLVGARIGTPIENYIEAYFFSVQTFTTVGYGRISPLGLAANILAAFESLTGLLSVALATGLLFTKFSRPNAKIIFSDYALIAPYKDISGFMFRIANQRKNQIIQMEALISYSRNEMINGERTRKFYELKLERKLLQFFPLSWTIVHPIDSESPLYNLSKEEFYDANPEFIILLKGFDDTFSQTVHVRYSYCDTEIEWGAKFSNIFDRPTSGRISINLDKIHDFEKADLEKY